MNRKGLRFVNFLLDTTIYFLLLIVVLIILEKDFALENIKWIACILYFLYYFLFEYFKGQTIGKMVTKSVVVSTGGNNNFYFIQLFLRTVMRFIPLDIFSYLFAGRGLHDRISRTNTIDVKITGTRMDHL